MEHKKSLRVLGLTEESSLKDLTSIFRKLVKKYHPDLNQDKQEWSNRQMLYINDAYNSAYEFLSQPQIEIDVPTIEEEKKQRDYSVGNISFEEGTAQAMKYLHEGICLYYQYGLENIALRQEGTRRTRYRSSIRRIKKSFALLQPIAELHLSKQELDQLEIIVNFIRYFYKSIHIKSIRAEENSSYEMKAFRHYVCGSKLVDSVLKEVMFKEFMEPYKRGRLTENIKLAEAELNTVLIDYPQALCVRESEIKKGLLLSFLEMTDLNDMGLIELYD
ncbi:MAG: J domain-containing protein [Spirochaetaceae bacterium]|nr:J domain-containing protein [Spirochaetaceae bacterium]